MKVSHIWQAALGYLSTTNVNTGEYIRPLAEEKSGQTCFSKDWLVLGPWQIGTREAAWGSDPTEKYGGFRSLAYDANAIYKSSIANNGTIAWTSLQAKVESYNESYTSAQLDVDFGNVDWAFLQQVYGWAATQWQGWARGTFSINLDSTTSGDFALYTEGILEFWVDKQHYFGGDFYSFRRAPVVLHLENGEHVVDVRLLRDVRAMGGVGKPSLDIKIALERANGTVRNVSELIISDIVAERGTLGSPYASLYLLNEGDQGVDVRNLRWHSRFCDFSSHTSLYIAPGQTRPVVFQVDCNLTNTDDALLEITWDEGFGGEAKSVILNYKLRQRTLHEPQKMTFLHPSGIVSYAIVRPPSMESLRKCGYHKELPVLLAMHGAGLEADDDLVKHSLDPLPDLCAWVIFPTGVTAWSGDDWHVWGSADIEAAIHAIKVWINQVDWQGIGVAVEKWLVTGHSNGGQGAWYVLTHKPDNVIAAAPISGYSSIQNYVPYSFWQPADYGRTAIIHASLNTYRHEIVMINAQGIPILQQHGGADDNVPAYHSRLLSQILQHVDVGSQYVEFPGKPHWWDGVITTKELTRFFQTELEGFRDQASYPLHEWSLVTSNPASIGPKQGIEIIHLINAGQLGKVSIRLNRTESLCVIFTSNVRTFTVNLESSRCRALVIDNVNMDLGYNLPNYVTATKTQGFTQHWTINHDSGYSTSKSISPLHKQNVGIDGILRSLGAFQIVQHSNSRQAAEVALQISRNLCQYFAADTDLEVDYLSARQAQGNIVSIAVGADLPTASGGYETIAVSDDELCIREKTIVHCYGGEKELSAIFLRPLPSARLELVIWAQQARNLGVAARLVPTLTGVGQPDFVILGDALSKGLENAVALGFYDESWGVSRNAFFT
ncbi:hypothetical protein K431DRAFT_265302 [Polychaeton citri CBS 116435]|uniref:Peptidase S9 prolyl oligopeptidase catalytic domain-containing protein n=1 Tax=Polychaeton citri CBS 116435 TaxID=1314669 RepID=A0A9P4Q9N2_9PEZI|nr:hypothetical protein K431DRAFT_265302 [Polychaeton citri CBS 116435]